MAVERINITDRETWLNARRHAVNASEVAIVLGEGAYSSLAELYAEKKGLRPPLTDSGILRRGRWGEPAVFEALAEECPAWDVLRAKIYLLDRDRRLGATPDGFAMRPDRPGRGVVQAKVVTRSAFRRRWLSDEDASIADGDAEVPIYYRLQTLTEMYLAEECAWGVLAVVIASEFDMTLRLFEIERDLELEAAILAGVERFWTEYFDPGIMPPFEPQRDQALIKALFPKDDGTSIDLGTHNRAGELADTLIETRAAVTRLKKTEQATAAELQGVLQGHTYGQLADGRVVSWKQQHRKAYPVAASDYRVLKVLKQMPTQRDDDEEE
jgi:predicted phage-related endonuclease